MQQLTYQEAYDLIIQAYFKDEIKPMDPKFCFCGTLNGNSQHWRESNSGYSFNDFKVMENALLSKLDGRYIVNINSDLDVEHSFWVGDLNEEDKDYETDLFKGMCAALDVLKEIHKNRGEIIDEPKTSFQKRKITTL